MKKSLSKPLSHTQKGYYARVERGVAVPVLQHGWAFDDAKPHLWTDVCADETVTRAELFSSKDRHRPHNKRRILASYSKQTSVEVVA